MFKYKTFKDNTDIKNMYEINYNLIDLGNLCTTCVINLILILFLSKEDTAFSLSNVLITILGALQIFFQFIFPLYLLSK